MIAPACTRCGAPEPYKINRPREWKCRVCLRRFFDREGTHRHRSKLSDDTWQAAESLFAKGHNARQVSLALNIQYRTAWLIAKRLEARA